MIKERYRNLDFFTIKFPFTSIISILHRLSGIFVFLLIPFLLWLLDVACTSSDGFSYIKFTLTESTSKCILWLILIALGYHLVAGLRHLLMDMGWGEGLHMARLSGGITLVISIVWAILMGIWLW
jgi:succinate dehydrogenase / fumarate reductase cytochrome b subunit